MNDRFARLLPERVVRAGRCLVLVFGGCGCWWVALLREARDRAQRESQKTCQHGVAFQGLCHHRGSRLQGWTESKNLMMDAPETRCNARYCGHFHQDNETKMRVLSMVLIVSL